LTVPKPDSAGPDIGRTSLELADWRRRITSLYAEVRDRAASDPSAAWEHWRAGRERMYLEHPQSPVPAADRAAYRGRYWPYDPAVRFALGVEDHGNGMAEPTSGDAARSILPMSAGTALDFNRIGRVQVPFPAGTRTLELFWMASYAGGLFLPFRDMTNDGETYAAGRYLLDTAKGADLGRDPATGGLVIDFNFAFQPSCAFDARWACPLAPPENRLDLPIRAGERLA
jgi:uncharacterized protein (DUF1684 family)